MEDPQERGKRLPAKGRAATEEPRAPKREPAPRPVPASKAKAPHPGVPMATTRKGPPRPERAEGEPMRRARTAYAEDEAPRPTRTRPERERSRPAMGAREIEEDFDLDDGPDEELDFGEDVDDEPAPPMRGGRSRARTPEKTAGTPSQVYSTRRALAEQINKEVGDRPKESDAKGVAAIREKREAWKKVVKQKEAEGKSLYMMRWAKVSFFPLLYIIISFQLLRRYIYEYGEYYEYNTMYMLLGLLVGVVTLMLFATLTMLKAKRRRGQPVLLREKSSFIGIGVFLAISLFLAFQYGLSYAWQFSMGFLASGLLIVLIGLAIERSSKGTFWVKDGGEGSSKRWLEFTPMETGGS